MPRAVAWCSDCADLVDHEDLGDRVPVSVRFRCSTCGRYSGSSWSVRRTARATISPNRSVFIKVRPDTLALVAQRTRDQWALNPRRGGHR